MGNEEVGTEASAHRGGVGGTTPTAHDNTERQRETHQQTTHTGGGATDSRGRETVETMPLPTKFKTKPEVKLWEEEEDERREETKGEAARKEDIKTEKKRAPCFIIRL